MQERKVLACNYPSIRKFKGCSGIDPVNSLALFLGHLDGLPGSLDNGSFLYFYTKFIHEKLYFLNYLFFSCSKCIFTGIAEISADYFLSGGFSNQLIIDDTKSDAVYSHIGGRFIEGRSAGYPLEDPLQQGESLDIPVVIDGLF